MTRRRMGVAAGLVMAAVLSLTVPVESAPDEPTVRFTAAGDYGAGANSSAVFAKIGELSPDAHLAVGDLSYGTTGQEQAWCDLVIHRVGTGFPFELLAGNHESNGQNGNINDFSACLPNQLPGLVGVYGRQYYVDVPAGAPLVRYVMISPALTFPDGAWSYAAGSPRYNWTAAAIDGARAAGIPWVVVGMHKPCLSVGEYACDPGADLVNMLVAKRVDLVLTGHEHLYQRTKQLARGAGCSSITPGTYTPACVVDADNDLVKGAGTVMATPGTGGIGLRDVHTDDPELPYFAATSGANQNPTFGVLDVSATADVLTATFQRASGGTFTDTFTIRRSTAPNTPPTAAVTSTTNGLSLSVSGSGSTDADGTIQSYAWNWGDNTASGSGVTASHTYAAAGTYTVTLTVTDDDGATDTETQPVTVASTPQALAADTFERSVAAGFGTADGAGGNWTVSNATVTSVANGVGLMRLNLGTGPSAYLNTVSAANVDATVEVSFDKPGTGGGIYNSLVVRRIGTSDYRLKTRITSTAVILYLARTINGAETVLATQTVPGLVYQPGQVLHTRLRVTGTGTTTLQGRLWVDGQTEPNTWNLTATDTTAALQNPGAVGVYNFLSSSATNAPVTVSVDDFQVVSAGP
jgi:PKD repeat protein